MALGTVREKREEMERRRAAGGSAFFGKTLLKFKKDQEIVVRPLEDGEDFVMRWCHAIPEVAKSGKRFTRFIVCLDQKGKGEVHCPGCEERANIADPKNDQRYARRARFWLNVIWRDGPIYERDAEGKLVKGDDGQPKESGRGDVIALWTGGQRAADALDEADDEYGGITSRDFRIKRKGEGFDTEYVVKALRDPDTGREADPNALTSGDKKLAGEKYDLAELSNPPDPDHYFEGGSGGGGGSSEPREDPAKKVSPFRRKREEAAAAA